LDEESGRIGGELDKEGTHSDEEGKVWRWWGSMEPTKEPMKERGSVDKRVQ